MSTRTGLRPQPVIVNGSMAGNLTSQPTVLQSLSCASYSFSWTGTSPVGTASLQVSDDFSLNGNGSVENPGTWNSAPVIVNGAPTTTINISGDTGVGFIDIPKTGAYATRVIYTAASGTGVLSVTMNGKVA